MENIWKKCILLTMITKCFFYHREQYAFFSNVLVDGGWRLGGGLVFSTDPKCLWFVYFVNLTT